jgi:catechol 2,3-dioxygenase-like lactoylglutathione lyase family enzyme
MLPWHHAHITLPDRQAGAIWYAKLGGRIGQPTPRSENIWYSENLLQIQTEAVAGDSEGWISHLGFSCSDLDNLLPTLDLTRSVTETPFGTHLIVDPWGTQIELIESEEDRFHHIQIVCRDPADLADWYARHLGGDIVACPWDNARLSIAYDSIIIAFATPEHLQKGTATSSDHQTGPGRNIDHIGWYTNDLAGTSESLREASVEFSVNPREFGSVQLAFITDPTGMWIELVEPPEQIIPKAK